MKLKPIRDNVLGIKGDFGDMETQAGLIIKSNIGKSEGITPRWFQIAAVGPEQKHLEPGMWVYVEYGRWTEAMELTDDRFDTEYNKADVWKVDPSGCLAVANEKPDTLNIASDDIVTAEKKSYI